MDDEPTRPEDDASLTGDPMVGWGAWAADRWSRDRAPSAWIVLGLLLGAPAALTLLVFLR